MKYCIDLTAAEGAVGILFTHRENEAVYVGTTVHTEPEQYRDHPLVKRYEAECDFHFFFGSDRLPMVYTVPKTEIAGFDSRGGLFAVTEGFSLTHGHLYYIDRNRRCYLAAQDGESLLKLGMAWRNRTVPADDLEAFDSRGEAEEKYKIWDWEDLLKEGDL